jgi:hypothetical protein
MKRFTFERHQDSRNQQSAADRLLNKTPLNCSADSSVLTQVAPWTDSHDVKKKGNFWLAKVVRCILCKDDGRNSELIKAVAHLGEARTDSTLVVQAGMQLTSILNHCNETMVIKRTLIALTALIWNGYDMSASSSREAEIALQCLHAGLAQKLINLIESHYKDTELLAEIQALIKLMLSRGKHVSGVVHSTGLLQVSTKLMLSDYKQVDSAILLSLIAKSLVRSCSAYDHDHFSACQNAITALSANPNNIVVGRIVCILLSFREWSRATDDTISHAKLLLRCCKQWPADEFIIRSAVLALRGLLRANNETRRSPLVTFLLGAGCCDFIMAFLYRFRRKPNVIEEIVQIIPELCDPISMIREDYKQFSVDMWKEILNSISMDFKWSQRRSYCVFLAQEGFLDKIDHVLCNSRISHDANKDSKQDSKMRLTSTLNQIEKIDKFSTFVSNNVIETEVELKFLRQIRNHCAADLFVDQNDKQNETSKVPPALQKLEFAKVFPCVPFAIAVVFSSHNLKVLIASFI